MDKINRAERFSFGVTRVILGLLLVTLLVFLVLASWRVYETGNNQIVYKNDKEAVVKCYLVEVAKCCLEEKPKASSKQKKTKRPPKQIDSQAQQKPLTPVTTQAISRSTPQAVVVEGILPRAVVIEQSIPTAIHQSVKP